MNMNAALWAAAPMSDVYRPPPQSMSVMPRSSLESAAAGASNHPLMPHHHHLHHQRMIVPPGFPMAFAPTSFTSNLDSVALQEGKLQDMSEQQRKILVKLESGFKGTVEELIEAVGSQQ